MWWWRNRKIFQAGSGWLARFCVALPALPLCFFEEKIPSGSGIAKVGCPASTQSGRARFGARGSLAVALRGAGNPCRGKVPGHQGRECRLETAEPSRRAAELEVKTARATSHEGARARADSPNDSRGPIRRSKVMPTARKRQLNGAYSCVPGPTPSTCFPFKTTHMPSKVPTAPLLTLSRLFLTLYIPVPETGGTPDQHRSYITITSQHRRRRRLTHRTQTAARQASAPRPPDGRPTRA